MHRNEKSKIKIIHAGDIHLDSAFSRYGIATGEERRAELRAVFAELIGYVKACSADIVLLSGDLFDAEYSTLGTLEMLSRELGSCRARFFISPGNHDPYKSDSIYASGKFPSNVHIFEREELCSVDIPELNTEVYGWAFTGMSHGFSPLAGKRASDPSKINLVCGHCDIESPLSGYCPVTEADISAFGADYTALSHIHNSPEQRLAGKAPYAYSGFLESRSFDERGRGGAWLVEIEKAGETGSISAQRLNFGRRRYEVLTLDVSGAVDSDAVYTRIRAALGDRDFGTQCSLRIILTGAVGRDFSAKDVESRNYGVEYVEIKDSTLPTYDSEYLMSDMTVKGELYRYLLPMLTEGTPKERETASHALRIGLSALDGGDITLYTDI